MCCDRSRRAVASPPGDDERSTRTSRSTDADLCRAAGATWRWAPRHRLCSMHRTGGACAWSAPTRTDRLAALEEARRSGVAADPVPVGIQPVGVDARLPCLHRSLDVAAVEVAPAAVA